MTNYIFGNITQIYQHLNHLRLKDELMKISYVRVYSVFLASSSLSILRRIFPLGDRGISLTNSTPPLRRL